MSDEKASEPIDRAAAEFEEFQRRRERGESADFDAFVAERPELASQLRFLASIHAFGPAPEITFSLRQIVAARFGEGGLERFFGERGPTSDRSVDSAAPTSIDIAGRYTSQGEVGRGGMSRILRVEDHELGRTLAMKVALDPSLRGARFDDGLLRDRLERFISEACITARLDHPGIVPVHDLGFDREGRAWFTMRLVRGKHFRSVIELAREEKECWNRARALAVLVKVCETVAYAHAKGVVHRDLKPDNILVGTFGEVYVIDWGLAKVLGAEDRHAVRLRFDASIPLSTVRTRHAGESGNDPEDPLVTPRGTIVGTPVYMPPEQAAGAVDRINATSDVYALGAILYTLLTGRPPYVRTDRRISPIEVLSAVIAGPPESIRSIDPTVPARLVAACEKAMARRQEDRYPDSLALAEDIERCLHEGIAASSMNAYGLEEGRNTGRRKGMLLAAGLIVLGSVALGLSLSGYFEPRDSHTMRLDAVLAELQRLSDLERDALFLAPASTDRSAALSDWLHRADALIERASASLEASRTWIQGDVRAGADPEAILSLSSGIDRLHRRLSELLSHDPCRGARVRVERELAYVRTIRAKSVDEAWDLWNVAITTIADSQRTPQYRGLAIGVREGLIPVGPDPSSGLWEFGSLRTGRVAERAADGSLRLDPDTGIVFVLIPGEAADPPFFFAKHPLTRGQWSRLILEDGAASAVDSADAHSRVAIAEARSAPIDETSVVACDAVLRSAGFALPSPSEWERARSLDLGRAPDRSGGKRAVFLVQTIEADLVTR
jgi:serine/threonine protein kinase